MKIFFIDNIENYIEKLIFADKTIQKYKVLMPKLPLSFTGTGDLFASLLLGWLHRTDHDVKVGEL